MMTYTSNQQGRRFGKGVVPLIEARGSILVVTMMMLVVITLMAVSVAKTFTMQERLAGNLKEKTRAFQAAQSTLSYAEYLLASQAESLATNVNCATALDTPTICDNEVVIENPTANNPLMVLKNGTPYKTMQPAMAISTTGGTDTYYAYPQYYIQYLGPLSSGSGKVFQVTALAYGGNENTVAIVQSTYKITPTVQDLGVQ